jgi:hypothetical protein
VIGSTGLTVLLAFFDAQPLLRDSDDERVAFAKYYLQDYRFLYSDSDDEDKKACESKHIICVLI